MGVTGSTWIYNHFTPNHVDVNIPSYLKLCVTRAHVLLSWSRTIKIRYHVTAKRVFPQEIKKKIHFCNGLLASIISSLPQFDKYNNKITCYSIRSCNMIATKCCKWTTAMPSFLEQKVVMVLVRVSCVAFPLNFNGLCNSRSRIGCTLVVWNRLMFYFLSLAPGGVMWLLGCDDTQTKWKRNGCYHLVELIKNTQSYIYLQDFWRNYIYIHI